MDSDCRGRPRRPSLPRNPDLPKGAWTAALRLGDPPVVPRIQGGAVLFDLRTLTGSDDEPLFRTIRQVAGLGLD